MATGREMAGATAEGEPDRTAADWTAAGWAVCRGAAGAALRVMTAAAVALPTAVMLRMSFGYLRIDVLNEDKGNLRSARHHAHGSHPGTCQLPADSPGRAAAYGRDAGAGRRAAQGGHLARGVLAALTMPQTRH